MPDPKQPRVYGTPTGYQAPDPTRQQKKPTPPTDAQVKQAYEAFMKEVIIRGHQAFKQELAKRGGQPPAGPATQRTAPRGSSTLARAQRPPAAMDAQINEQSK